MKRRDVLKLFAAMPVAAAVPATAPIRSPSFRTAEKLAFRNPQNANEPTITFRSDPDTGLYRVTEGEIAATRTGHLVFVLGRKTGA